MGAWQYNDIQESKKVSILSTICFAPHEMAPPRTLTL
jgi:hypothetical protein